MPIEITYYIPSPREVKTITIKQLVVPRKGSLVSFDLTLTKRFTGEYRVHSVNYHISTKEQKVTIILK